MHTNVLLLYFLISALMNINVSRSSLIFICLLYSSQSTVLLLCLNEFQKSSIQSESTFCSHVITALILKHEVQEISFTSNDRNPLHVHLSQVRCVFVSAWRLYIVIV